MTGITEPLCWRMPWNGNPALCQSCHADPACDGTRKAGCSELFIGHSRISCQPALAGWTMKHATCVIPVDPKAIPACFRGRHSEVGVNCTECHGTLEDHALGLLANQGRY